METTTVEMAAAARTIFALPREQRMSPMVYLPAFRSGSAISKRMVTNPRIGPVEYRKPSNPYKEMRPDIPRKEAAETTSPVMAQPFWSPVIPPPAV